jgi:acetyl-CoA carboxylase biotin carboxyl carrier protein
MQVVAEMVALVHSLEAAIGDQVEPGDTLLILESMKMEIPVLAEGAGTVIEFAVVVGDVVNEGDLLVILQ